MKKERRGEERKKEGHPVLNAEHPTLHQPACHTLHLHHTDFVFLSFFNSINYIII